jgi:GH25 family lysozyme M1 (1,4-beta-N-acetylmuramidase)
LLNGCVVVAVLAVSPTATAASDAPAGGGFAGHSGEADEATSGRAGRPQVGPTLPGIDVSHWQDTIDWQKVAGAGKRFAFLKATDGHDYLDPTFATNRAGARANGLIVGAYHFARPDPSKGDAVEEARWFVSQADPKPGNLLPVLDLETSKGLDQQGITLWARRWVAEVRRLTGVTPLMYTSPYGWASRTGDSRSLARDGVPLWVAHWGVESPLLPAADWDGNGWRVWQHTSDGHVAGIRGRVDLDVVKGTSLGPITIRRLTLEVEGDAGQVTSTPAGLGCRTTCSKNADPNATITLTARPDDKAYFTGWGGACKGDEETCAVTMRGNRSVRATFVTDITPPNPAATAAPGFNGPLTVRFDESVRRVRAENVLLRRAGGDRVAVDRVCRSAGGARVTCDGMVRTVVMTPVSSLVPGRDYQVIVNPQDADPVVDRVGNIATSLVEPFEGPSSVEQGHVPVTLRPARAWQVERAARASGGSFAMSDEPGAVVEMRFDGVGIDWMTVTGPNRGRARVSIDGGRVRVVDLHSTRRRFGVVERIDGLSDGSHTLRIEVLAGRSPRSHGRWIAIDRFDVLAA